MKKLSRKKRAEINIINSPFSQALGWKTKSGNLSALGKSILPSAKKRRK